MSRAVGLCYGIVASSQPPKWHLVMQNRENDSGSYAWMKFFLLWHIQRNSASQLSSLEVLSLKFPLAGLYGCASSE